MLSKSLLLRVSALPPPLSDAFMDIEAERHAADRYSLDQLIHIVLNDRLIDRYELKGEQVVFYQGDEPIPMSRRRAWHFLLRFVRNVGLGEDEVAG